MRVHAHALDERSRSLGGVLQEDEEDRYGKERDDSGSSVRLSGYGRSGDQLYQQIDRYSMGYVGDDLKKGEDVSVRHRPRVVRVLSRPLWLFVCILGLRILVDVLRRSSTHSVQF